MVVCGNNAFISSIELYLFGLNSFSIIGIVSKPPDITAKVPERYIC